MVVLWEVNLVVLKEKLRDDYLELKKADPLEKRLEQSWVDLLVVESVQLSVVQLVQLSVELKVG